jgi:hypothetical protein
MRASKAVSPVAVGWTTSVDRAAGSSVRKNPATLVAIT